MTRTLLPAPERGLLTGFGTLFRREFGAWAGTRRWWLQLLLWLGLTNAWMAPVCIGLAALPGLEIDRLEMLAKLFFGLGGTALACGALAIGQDAIIGERQMGTAAWILTKPVARTAFIGAKFAALATSMTTLAVLIPAVCAYGQIALLVGQAAPVLPFAVGTGLLALHLLFYVSLTLLLGVLFRTRSLVLLAGLGWLFGSPFLVQIMPAIARVLPVGLPDQAVALVLGMPLSQLPLLPALLAAGWSVAFLVAATILFEREEL
ncbi:MAG TPA: ABC transporter permease subunit [Symbiobacteriaceae bacterium]|nr:ABC transporter permease subunit [Symbiobacteriaceae bacterium]